MINYQRAPALGVGPAMRLSWAVPPSSAVSHGVALAQTSYRVRFTDAATSSVVWDSGTVTSNASVNVAGDAIKVLVVTAVVVAMVVVFAYHANITRTYAQRMRRTPA